MMKTIGEVAILSGIFISVWDPKKTNTTVAQEGAEKHNVKRMDALKAVKYVLPKEAMSKITNAKSMARQYHYHVTLPWSRGWGLLPAVRFFEYMDVMRKHREEFESAVIVLKENYLSFVERDEMELGDLFDPSDYPTVQALDNYFAFKVRTLPVPDKGHFIVDLGNEGLEELKASTEETIRLQLQEAQKVPWQRLMDAVGRMVERLSDPDKIFRDSLLENVASLCNVLPSFSTITGDRELDNIRREVENKLLQASADVLRDNKRIRKSVAQEAEEIIKKMEAYGMA